MNTFNIDINNDGTKIAIANAGGNYLQVFDVSGSSWLPVGDNIYTNVELLSNNISISIDGSGNTLAIGCYNGSSSDVVKVYELNNSNSWVQKGDDITSSSNKNVGRGVKLSVDGSKLFVGGFVENSSDEGFIQSYEYSGSPLSDWTSIADDLSLNSSGNLEGFSFDIDNSGETMVVGFPTSTYSGKVEVYNLNNTDDIWVKDLSFSNTISSSYNNSSLNIGIPVSINNDGSIVSFSVAENSLVNGYQTMVTKVYENSSGWSQLGSDISTSYSDDGDDYGVSSKLNSTGNIVAVISNSLENDSNNNASLDIYSYDVSWSQLGSTIDLSDLSYGPLTVALNSSGNVITVGSGYITNSNDGYIFNGLTKIYEYNLAFTSSNNNLSVYNLNSSSSLMVLNNTSSNTITFSVSELQTTIGISSDELDSSLTHNVIEKISISATNENSESVTDFTSNNIEFSSTLSSISYNSNKSVKLYKLNGDGDTIVSPQPTGFPVTLTYNSTTGYWNGAIPSLSNFAIIQSTTASSSSSGDPHVYPLYGEHYELPQIPSYYRMVQGNGLIINCSTRNITEKETKSIIKYIENNSNEIINESYLSALINKGVFYDKIYINSDGNQILFSFTDNKIAVFDNNPDKKYFKLERKCYNKLYGNKYETDTNIIQYKLIFNNNRYGNLSFDLNYFQNPQIKYGIGMNYDKNNRELSGLLLREYKIKSMEIKKLNSLKPCKGVKGQNKKYSKFVKVLKY